MANDRTSVGREDVFYLNLDSDKRWVIPFTNDLIRGGRADLVPFFLKMASLYPDITQKYAVCIILNLAEFLETYRKKNPGDDGKALAKAARSYINDLIKQLKTRERVTEGDTQAEHRDAVRATVPKDDPYKRLSDQLEGELHDVRRRIATELAPALNARIQAMPHSTYEEKKELARWVNEELRRFDLAIKGPTGQPSSLVAARGNPPDVEIGRLFLEYKSSDGNRARTQVPPQLPPFELMEAAPRREALREWHEKVSRQRGGASRA